jgi:hypothetical protein
MYVRLKEVDEECYEVGMKRMLMRSMKLWSWLVMKIRIEGNDEDINYA